LHIDLCNGDLRNETLKGRDMPKAIDEAALFEATVREFAELGYAEATTLGIAKRAGINEVTLFRRYGNKADLIRAALLHVLARAPFAAVEASGDVRADLTAVVTALVATTRAYGGAVMTLLTEIPRHPELRDGLAALAPNLRNAASIIEAHQRAGRVGPGDPFEKLALLVSPVVAMGIWGRAQAGLFTGHLEPAAIVEAFLNGNTARAVSP
jgi:AcrR family transcriptional regulator